MSEGTPRPRRTYASTEEHARRAHEATVSGRSSRRPPASGRRSRLAAGAAAVRGGGSGLRRGLLSRPRGVRGWLTRVLAALVLMFVLGCLAIIVIYQKTDLPNPNAIAASQVSIVYFDDGKTEIGRITSGANRESVGLEKVPVPVQRAFLAAEDRTFYENRGISPTGIGRAVLVGLRGGQTQGGSTITQQYVKNYFLSSDQTIRRKVKEIFLSVKVDETKSKEEILRDYLNTIYFGRGAYGIQTASKAYFDKDVSQLTPAEGAVLASIVKGPNLYDPSRSEANRQRSQARARWILDGMVQQKWLTPEQRATMTIPDVIPKKKPGITGGTNGYLVAAAKDELMARAKLANGEDVDAGTFEQGGLRITTSINQAQQQKAVESVERYWPQGMKRVHIGLAAVKPGEGSITAMWGGRDFLEQSWNDATQEKISGGSTFKVFTLAAALEHGVSSRSTVSGSEPYEAPGTKKPIRNHESKDSAGSMTLRDALANSVNTAYARINWALGPKRTSEMADRLGVPVPESHQDIVGNTLGLSDASAVQMAGAFATFAAKGKYVKPHIVTRATTVDGTLDYKADTTAKQVVSEEVSADVVDAMKRVIQDGTGTQSIQSRFSRPAAGKTGTGEDNTTAWFDGFVPQLATAVSMNQRNTDPKKGPMKMTDNGQPVYGGGIPAKIWARFMREALQGVDVEELPERARVGKYRNIGADPQYGKLLTDSQQVPQEESGGSGSGGTSRSSDESTGGSSEQSFQESAGGSSEQSVEQTSGRSSGYVSEPTRRRRHRYTAQPGPAAEAVTTAPVPATTGAPAPSSVPSTSGGTTAPTSTSAAEPSGVPARTTVPAPPTTGAAPSASPTR